MNTYNLIKDQSEFYPLLQEWLKQTRGCLYAKIRKTILRRQPDVLGIEFKRGPENLLRADLHIIEVNIVNNVFSAYQAIGELEAKSALFAQKFSLFYAIHPYLAILETKTFEELELYANHRKVGLIKLLNEKEISIKSISPPSPIILNNFISIDQLEKNSFINSDEKRLLKEAIKVIGWRKIKEIISS